MIIKDADGKNYNIESENQNLEIIVDSKVYIFQDLSIGNFMSKRREAIFYSYDIDEDGNRTFSGRHNFIDFENEFEAFLESEVWKSLMSEIIIGFLKKVKFTEPITKEVNET